MPSPPTLFKGLFRFQSLLFLFVIFHCRRLIKQYPHLIDSQNNHDHRVVRSDRSGGVWGWRCGKSRWNQSRPWPIRLFHIFGWHHNQNRYIVRMVGSIVYLAERIGMPTKQCTTLHEHEITKRRQSVRTHIYLYILLHSLQKNLRCTFACSFRPLHIFDIDIGLHVLRKINVL